VRESGWRVNNKKKSKADLVEAAKKQSLSYGGGGRTRLTKKGGGILGPVRGKVRHKGGATEAQRQQKERNRGILGQNKIIHVGMNHSRGVRGTTGKNGH